MANQSDLKIKIISFVKSNEVAEKNLEEVAELGRKLYEEVMVITMTPIKSKILLSWEYLKKNNNC